MQNCYDFISLFLENAGQLETSEGQKKELDLPSCTRQMNSLVSAKEKLKRKFSYVMKSTRFSNTRRFTTCFRAMKREGWKSKSVLCLMSAYFRFSLLVEISHQETGWRYAVSTSLIYLHKKIQLKIVCHKGFWSLVWGPNINDLH